MKRTPAQIGMGFLLGRDFPMLRLGDLKSKIQRGREELVRVTRQDFGYDAMRWHEYLWQTNAGGYRWSRRSADKYARIVLAHMSRPEWVEAVKELEASNAQPERQSPDRRPQG